MDKLEIKIEERQGETRPYKVAVILINDLSLIEQLKKHELPFAKTEGAEHIAGGYSELSPEQLLKHLTIENSDDEGSKVSVLECECGSEGCWPMNINIKQSDNSVVWLNFEQPHRSKDGHSYWDYTGFGPFKFDSAEYDKEIEKLKTGS